MQHLLLGSCWPSRNKKHHYRTQGKYNTNSLLRMKERCNLFCGRYFYLSYQIFLGWAEIWSTKEIPRNNKWLNNIKLTSKIEKTKYMVQLLFYWYTKVGKTWDWQRNSNSPVQNIKYLVFRLASNLKWHQHIKNLTKRN